MVGALIVCQVLAPKNVVRLYGPSWDKVSIGWICGAGPFYKSVSIRGQAVVASGSLVGSVGQDLFIRAFPLGDRL